MTRIRLLVVDDHVLFRQSLCSVLASEPDFEVVADCGTREEALAVLRHSDVDVILLDFDLGHERGSHLIDAIRRADAGARILMVTADMTGEESSTAIRLGASGVFLKHGSPAALLQAIRLVAGGTIWVDEVIIRRMAAQANDQPVPGERTEFTEREQQVLQGAFEGLANKEIGARLGISESAVKATMQRLFRKTHVRTRSQLVRVALEGSVAATRRP